MFDFPSSPTNGQTVTMPDGTVRQWDGSKWVAGASAAGVTYAPLVSPTFSGNPTAPTPTAGDNDTSIATTAFVATALATAGVTAADTPPATPINGQLWWDSTGCQLYVWYADANSSQWVAAANPYSFATAPADLSPAQTNVGRNKLHNPLFNIQQRTAGTYSASGYTLDRWYLSLTSDTVTVSQIALTDADRTAIGDEEANYGLQNQFTGNAAATAFTEIYQRIENVRRLANKTVTISFWAKAVSGTPKLGLNILQYFGTGGSPSASVRALATGNAVTLSTTWTRYTSTIAIPSIVGKTLGSANDHSTQLEFWFSSGANNNAVAGNIGVQAATVWLWGAQLEVGTMATPLEKPDIPSDLANCQRFYQTGTVFAGGYSASAINAATSQMYPVVMRAAPTVAIPLNSDVSLTSPTQNANAFYINFVGTTPASSSGWQINRSFTVSADL